MKKNRGERHPAARGTSIAVRLAILTVAMAACYSGVLFISSSGFARLNEAVVQVNRVQGSFVRTADALQSQCDSIELFVLSNAMESSSSAKGVGTNSRATFESLTNSAKTAAKEIAGLKWQGMPGAVRENVLSSFDEYMTSLEGLSADLDAGKDRLAKRLENVQTAFLVFSNNISVLLAALRQAGDAAAAEAAKLTQMTSLILSGVIIGAVLICILIAILIIRSITRPLGGLVAAVKRIGDGDLTAAVGSKSRDELGKIATSVDELVVELRVLIGSAKERLCLLEETGQTLSSTMAQTGAAVVQINSNISSTGGQLGEQSSAVCEVTAAIEELARSVDALGSMIANQSSVISQSSAAVEEMIANVESVAANVAVAVDASTALIAEGGEGKTRIDEVGESVAAIVRYSENLGQAAELITQIAQRTNLLAMNAAIEAAHAGDAGRGFAVVADEIRKLAEQSTAQSKDISTDLDKVTKAIDDVRDASVGAVESFSAILGKSTALGDEVRSMGASMAEQREGGQQVLEGLARLRDITREIERGSDEMAKGNESILQQVQKLTNVNTAVVRNNVEMTSGTSEINQAVAGTIELSSRNSELIGQLRLAMDKFQI